MTHYFKKIQSPVGELKLIASEKGLSAVLWENDKLTRVPVTACEENNNHPVLREAEKQLREYFDKKRKIFSLPLDFVGTEFQKKVWNALLEIPFGETRTYGEMAKQVGDPKAARAIGGAVNKNPISIIAPCHRVIGASGQLVGFGGGLENKSRLLEIEGKTKDLVLF